MQKRILISGSAGFLGRQVVKQLRYYAIAQAAEYAQIFPTDNFESGCGSQDEADSDTQYLDVTSPGNFPWKPTHIIHLAAIGRNLTCEANPYRAFQVNVNGSINMMELAKKHGAKLILCSSNIVLSSEETVYRMTKRCMEELGRIYARHGTDVMILRPSNMGGPGQSRTEYQPCCFAAMDKCFEQNGYIEITGDGSQTRDFIDVRDAARAFVLALDNFHSGVTLDICSGVQHSMKDIAESLSGVPIRYVEPRPGDAKALISDHRPATNLMYFVPKISFSETVRDSFPAVMNARVAR